MTRYYCRWKHSLVPYGKVVNICIKRGKGNRICKNLEEARKTKKGKRDRNEKIKR